MRLGEPDEQGLQFTPIAECASEYCIEYAVHAIEARMPSRRLSSTAAEFSKWVIYFIRRSPPRPAILSSCIIAPLGVGAIAKLLLQLFSADRSPSADFRTPFWHISGRGTDAFHYYIRSFQLMIELIGTQRDVDRCLRA